MCRKITKKTNKQVQVHVQSATLWVGASAFAHGDQAVTPVQGE